MTMTMTPPPSAIEEDIRALEKELTGYYQEMKVWGQGDLGEAFQKLSGYSARASELKARTHRSNNRSATTFRTRQLDPFLEECDRQFKVLSRIQSLRQFDWDVSKGGT